MSDPDGLTARQRNILDFVVQHQDENGYPPTIREIGEFFRIRSTNGVSDHLRALERKGYLSRTGQQSRGLTILQRPETGEAPRRETAGPGQATRADGGAEVIRLPVLGKVAAGRPLLAIEEDDETVSVDPALLGGLRGPRDLFALRVQGRSMIGAGILPGDLVFVRRSPLVDNGRIAVVMIDGEATVKRFYHEGDRIRLQPENPEMAPMIVGRDDPDGCEVIGTVIGLFRRLD